MTNPSRTPAAASTSVAQHSLDELARELARLSLALGDWGDGDGPLYARLADAFAHAVGRRRIRPGERLPPERQLALHLKVGRSTVIRAYTLLRESGILESRQGSGSWVAESAFTLALAPSILDGLSEAAPARERVVIDLATASLDADSALAEELTSITAADARMVLDGAGYSVAGLEHLREMIAAQYESEGLPTDLDQVLVTSGAQQSISLIARRFLTPGDVVVLEDPTSAGALDIFSEAQASIRSTSVSVAESAADIVDAVRRGSIAMAYLSLPAGPRGQMATRGDVELIAAAVSNQRSLIVEEHGLRDLALTEPPPYLASLTSQPVLSVGSMSKLFWGGLRVGWIRGPESLIESLTRTKARADLGTSTLSQHVAMRLLARREEIRERRLAHIRANIDLAVEHLAQLMPELEWQLPDAGVTVWARLPYGTSTRFARHAHDCGVRIAAGQSFSPSGRSNDRIRISLAPTADTLAEGFERLARAWCSFGPPHGNRRANRTIDKEKEQYS